MPQTEALPRIASGLLWTLGWRFAIFSLLLIEAMDQVDPSHRQWLMRGLIVPGLEGLPDPIENGVPPLLLREGHTIPTHAVVASFLCEAHAQVWRNRTSLKD